MVKIVKNIEKQKKKKKIIKKVKICEKDDTFQKIKGGEEWGEIMENGEKLSKTEKKGAGEGQKGGGTKGTIPRKTG